MPGATTLAESPDPTAAELLSGTVVMATDVVTAYHARLTRWLVEFTGRLDAGKASFTARCPPTGELPS